MFSKHYVSELMYLREVGRLFGLANPSIAGLLVERGTDPDVERLLEGFAFLTARIRERVEDAVPEVIHGLAELLLPHYLRPLPACSIVEFSPQVAVLRERLRVPAGAELASRPVEGTACRFRTTADLELLPVTVESAYLDRSSATAPVLRLGLKVTAPGQPGLAQAGSLRFFLHAELAVGALVLLWLLRYCRGVTVRGGGKQARLGPEAIRASGLEPGLPLLPWRRALDGPRLLQEYFTLPEKFLFFEIRGLEATAEVAAERVELAFELERPPQLEGRIGREMFRLNCAPVINLFSANADPVVHRALDREHLLRASEVQPRHMEVYSVDEVIAATGGRSERRALRPFHEFAHAEPGDALPTFYQVRRVPSPVDDGLDTYLSLETPRDVAPELAREETLSVAMTCTNRSLPAQLQVGDLCRATASSPAQVRFRNILPVSKPARAPLASELHWRLVSHLALNQRSLAETATLQRLLEIYNFQGLSDGLAARANRLRINAVRKVEGRPVTRFLEGVPLRGCRVQVELDERGFTSSGDAFLLGAVLDELFASQATLNSFSELALRLSPSQTEYAWAPRNGSRPIL